MATEGCPVKACVAVLIRLIKEGLLFFLGSALKTCQQLSHSLCCRSQMLDIFLKSFWADIVEVLTYVPVASGHMQGC